MSATPSSSATGRLYRMAPLDRTGVLLGLTLLQVIVTGAGLLLGAVVMSSVSFTAGAAVAVMVGALGLARVGGQPVLAQVPLALGWLRRGRQASSWLAPVQVVGGSVAGRRRAGRGDRLWGSLELLSVDPAAYSIVDGSLRGPVAIAIDRRSRACSVSVRIAGRQFALLEPHEQDWVLAGWGNVLGQFVSERPRIVHVQWSEWACPSGIAEHRAWLEAHKAAQPIPDAVAAWDELLGQTGVIATRHDVLLTLTAHPSRVRVLAHHASRRAATIEALLSETRALLQRLQGAGLATTVLTPRELHRALRLRLDPSVRATLDRRDASLGASAGGVSEGNALPLATKESWSWLAVDNTVHRTFVVTEWPRIDVPGDWLGPLLGWSGAVRSVHVFFIPVPRSRSLRWITAQATRIEAERQHRAEKQWRIGASLGRDERAVRERDEELVAGFVEHQFAGFVTVAASSLNELDQVSSDVVDVAAGCGIELRPLHGRHQRAFFSCLPLARGVRARRFT